jgi:hypothetical protein
VLPLSQSNFLAINERSFGNGVQESGKVRLSPVTGRRGP